MYIWNFLNLPKLSPGQVECSFDNPVENFSFQIRNLQNRSLNVRLKISQRCCASCYILMLKTFWLVSTHMHWQICFVPLSFTLCHWLVALSSFFLFDNLTAKHAAQSCCPHRLEPFPAWAGFSLGQMKPKCVAAWRQRQKKASSDWIWVENFTCI